MEVLFIGSDLGYLDRLRNALSLSTNEVSLVQTAGDLAKVDVKVVKIVFLDLLWNESNKSNTNIDSAIKLLRETSYTGTIEPCAANPHSNSYIAKLLGGSSVWEQEPEAKELPDLSIEEVAEKLAPLLAA